ncbi:MAG: MBL fold metallo-hydrolase [Lachnospiraceae bacterium]|jgi:hydroxyacylglutathione hydrolase|nr:MBL fold metallo-hydrolase [Lachnospiraceae bacterium]
MTNCKDELRVRQIDDGTWMITDFFNDHMYLLEGSQEALLIDTGIGSLTLSDRIRELTGKPLRVALTHGHVDHIGAAGICERTDALGVFLSSQDFSLYQEHSGPECRKAYCEKKFERYGADLVDSEKKEYLHRLLSIEPCDRLCPLPDHFNLGDRTIHVIRTPGHTLGSVCFLDEKTQILFSGDTVCDVCVLLDFEHSAPPEVFLSSLQRLKSYPIVRIYCGHHRGWVAAGIIDHYISLCRHILHIPERERKKLYLYQEIAAPKEQTEIPRLALCLPISGMRS